MKQETFEEAAKRMYGNDEDGYYAQKRAFKIGAKWQRERMYSEEDLRNAFFSFPDEWICFEEWFEQFKKK